MKRSGILPVVFASATAFAVFSIAAAQSPESAKALPAGSPRSIGVEKFSPAHRQFLDLSRANGLTAERQRILTTWKGTTITPHSRVVGNLLAQHQAIAKQFSLQDPLPNVRRTHFQWCDREGFVCQGWKGTIVNMQRSPAGVIVQVKVWPEIVSTSVRMSDYFLETYEYSDTGLQFIEGKGPDPAEDGGIVYL